MQKLKTFKNEILSIASLFTSASTLICCALPIFLVTIGLGAVMAGITANAPWLITFSKYKLITFIVAGGLIGTSFWFAYGKKDQAACEIDEHGKETACNTASRWSKVILWISAGLYVIGFTASYLYVPITQLF